MYCMNPSKLRCKACQTARSCFYPVTLDRIDANCLVNIDPVELCGL